MFSAEHSDAKRLTTNNALKTIHVIGFAQCRAACLLSINGLLTTTAHSCRTPHSNKTFVSKLTDRGTWIMLIFGIWGNVQESKSTRKRKSRSVSQHGLTEFWVSIERSECQVFTPQIRRTAPFAASTFAEDSETDNLELNFYCLVSEFTKNLLWQDWSENSTCLWGIWGQRYQSRQTQEKAFLNWSGTRQNQTAFHTKAHRSIQTKQREANLTLPWK